MGDNRYLNDGSTYIDCGGTKDGNNYRWTIEEVQYLPVAVSTTVKYGTLYAPVDLSLRTGLEAYTATVDGTKLKLQPIKDKIPAGTAVILKDNDAERDPVTECIYLEVTSGAASMEGNALTGTYKTIANPASGTVKIYTLQNQGSVGMYKYTGDNLNGFKAYLRIDGGSANSLSFDEGGQATGIGEAAAESIDDAPAYDLSGRRVSRNTKGILIVGNKKIVNL